MQSAVITGKLAGQPIGPMKLEDTEYTRIVLTVKTFRAGKAGEEMRVCFIPHNRSAFLTKCYENGWSVVIVARDMTVMMPEDTGFSRPVIGYMCSAVDLA